MGGPSPNTLQALEPFPGQIKPDVGVIYYYTVCRAKKIAEIGSLLPENEVRMWWKGRTKKGVAV